MLRAHEDKSAPKPKMRVEDCSQMQHKTFQSGTCPECGNLIPVCATLESQDAQRYFGKRLRMHQPPEPLDVEAERRFAKDDAQLVAEREFAETTAEREKLEARVGDLIHAIRGLRLDPLGTHEAAGDVFRTHFGDPPKWRDAFLAKLDAMVDVKDAVIAQLDELREQEQKAQVRANKLERLRCARMLDWKAEHREEYQRRAAGNH